MAFVTSIQGNIEALDASSMPPALYYKKRDQPDLKINTLDQDELSDSLESPVDSFDDESTMTPPPMPAGNLSRRGSLTATASMLRHKRSCSALPTWSLADQLDRCSLGDIDEREQQQKHHPSEPMIHQRRASAHVIDVYTRRRHHPYTAPLRIYTAPAAIIEQTVGSNSSSSREGNTTGMGFVASAPSGPHSSVTAAAIVYLSRRGRRNAIGSAAHELVLTRRVCRQMPA